jgi:hypothetical protein
VNGKNDRRPFERHRRRGAAAALAAAARGMRDRSLLESHRRALPLWTRSTSWSLQSHRDGEGEA